MNKSLIIILSLIALQLMLPVAIAQEDYYAWGPWEPNEVLTDFMVRFRYEFLILAISLIITVTIKSSLSYGISKGKVKWAEADINRVSVALFIGFFFILYMTGSYVRAYVDFLFMYVGLIITVGLGVTLYTLAQGLPDDDPMPWKTITMIIGLIIVGGLGTILGQFYISIIFGPIIIYYFIRWLLKKRNEGGLSFFDNITPDRCWNCNSKVGPDGVCPVCGEKTEIKPLRTSDLKKPLTGETMISQLNSFRAMSFEAKTSIIKQLKAISETFEEKLKPADLTTPFSDDNKKLIKETLRTNAVNWRIIETALSRIKKYYDKYNLLKKLGKIIKKGKDAKIKIGTKEFNVAEYAAKFSYLRVRDKDPIKSLFNGLRAIRNANKKVSKLLISEANHNRIKDSILVKQQGFVNKQVEKWEELLREEEKLTE